jgi:hypothetical protein
MPSDGPFLDLEMMGEASGDEASWWKGRGWSEMRAMMSNPVERHWILTRVEQNCKKWTCVNYFASILLRKVPEAAHNFF